MQPGQVSQRSSSLPARRRESFDAAFALADPRLIASSGSATSVSLRFINFLIASSIKMGAPQISRS
jgi:hypothetical protein